MSKIWRNVSGISDDKISGITAEKNKTADMDTTATINFVTTVAWVTTSAGKNTSANDNDSAFAAKYGSGTCNTYVNGTKIYASQSKIGVYVASTSPSRPIDRIDGITPIAMMKPSFRFDHKTLDKGNFAQLHPSLDATLL